MKAYQIRPLERDDFSALMRLEEEVFARKGEAVLGAYCVRLCCEFFPEACFVAVDRDALVRSWRRYARLANAPETAPVRLGSAA
jgi:hypothetical protein